MQNFKPFTEYTNEATATIYDDFGAFWAFSSQQFEDAKKPGVIYTRFWGGCFAPADRAGDFIKKYTETLNACRKKFVAENDRAAIILYELNNYESFYTYDTTEAAAALAEYGITNAAEIQKVFNENAANYD